MKVPPGVWNTPGGGAEKQEKGIPADIR